MFFSFASLNSAKMKKTRCEFCLAGDFLSSFLTNNIRPPMRKGSRGRRCVSQSLTLVQSYRLRLFVVAVWQCVWWLRHLTVINWLSQTAVEILSDAIASFLDSKRKNPGLTLGNGSPTAGILVYWLRLLPGKLNVLDFFLWKTETMLWMWVFFGKDQHMASSD